MQAGVNKIFLGLDSIFSDKMVPIARNNNAPCFQRFLPFLPSQTGFKGRVQPRTATSSHPTSDRHARS